MKSWVLPSPFFFVLQHKTSPFKRHYPLACTLSLVFGLDHQAWACTQCLHSSYLLLPATISETPEYKVSLGCVCSNRVSVCEDQLWDCYSWYLLPSVPSPASVRAGTETLTQWPSQVLSGQHDWGTFVKVGESPKQKHNSPNNQTNKHNPPNKTQKHTPHLKIN